MTILFVGRATLDLGYICTRFPGEDSKLSAEHFTMAGGGPALNAAVAARALGAQVRLAAPIGTGPLAGFVRDELAGMGIDLVDLAASDDPVLPVSSIVVVPANGTRTVVDQQPADALRSVDPEALFTGVDCVLSDGHCPKVAVELLHRARKRGIPTVLDGGSWKPGAEEILTLIDHAIVSERFRPGGEAAGDLAAVVQAFGPPRVAVTHGAEAIEWSDGHERGTIVPPRVEAVDTLGAGDIFHGAFCHSLASGAGFVGALEQAAAIAAHSCESFGTRAWIAGLG